MIGMAVGDDDQIHVFRGEGKSGKPITHVIEQMIVARVYEDPFFTVDEIGIAVVRGHAVPWEQMQMIQYLHKPSIFKGWSDTEPSL